MTKAKTKKTFPKKNIVFIVLVLAIIVSVSFLWTHLFSTHTQPWTGGDGTTINDLKVIVAKLDLPKPASALENNSGCTEYTNNPDTYFCARTITYKYQNYSSFWPALRNKLLAEGWTFAKSPFDGSETTKGLSAHIPTACISVQFTVSSSHDPSEATILFLARGSNLCYGTSSKPADM